MNYLKSILMSLASGTLLFSMTSCDDSIIFEGEGNCEPPVVETYTPHVQFVFKKHRQALHSLADRERDVFYSTVASVHLFVFNAETGEEVYDRIEKTDNLFSALDLRLSNNTDRCYMPLDLAPGKYRLVAWCGLDENDHNNAFSLSNQLTKGFDYKECGVKFDEMTGHPLHHEKYDGLYHGRVESFEIKEDNSEPQIIPIELTKDNNDIAVWIQHTSVTFDKDEYEVVYVDGNGTMNFDDNSISKSDRLEYFPHSKTVLESSTQFNGEDMLSGALVAHISTSRLMADNKDTARLEVRNKYGATVFSVPFIKYVLELQTFSKDSQYYLDCEDTYNCSFYITGDNELWAPGRIIINNWVKVPDQEGPLNGE